MKAEQLEGQVKGSDMRTVSASHSFRTLAVVVNLEGTWAMAYTKHIICSKTQV